MSFAIRKPKADVRLQISDFMLLAGQSVAYGQWVIAVDELDWKVSHPEGCASVTFTYLIGSTGGAGTDAKEQAWCPGDDPLPAP